MSSFLTFESRSGGSHFRVWCPRCPGLWAITRFPCSGRFEVHICSYMPNIWKTERRGEAWGCRYIFTHAKVVNSFIWWIVFSPVYHTYAFLKGSVTNWKLLFACISRNEALRVAFIDVVETMKDGKVQTEYYSKLVKGDINGLDKVNLPFISCVTISMLHARLFQCFHLSLWILG